MDQLPEGNAIVYCQGAFNRPNGKTAHGLVRFTKRYNVLAVVDQKYAGKDAGMVLDNRKNGIAVLASLDEAIALARSRGQEPTHLVVGLAPDGGRLSERVRGDVKQALKHGLNVDCGLHDFLSEDPEMVDLAEQHNVTLRDIRKPPHRSQLHFFSGKIEQVKSLKIAVLGTDSALGKRTTAWILVNGLRDAGISAEMIGTGQTGWMQGTPYSLVMDSLVNDFVSGEIEHAVWSAWNQAKPKAIIIEGQGSLMNPAYPGGFEILAGGRPDIIVLQHAPARKDYDGFPGYPIQPLAKQIEAVELLSGKPVVAVTISHEDMIPDEVPYFCNAIEKVVGIPAFDVLLHGPQRLVGLIKPHLLNNVW